MKYIPPLNAATTLTSAVATATTGLQAITVIDTVLLANAQNPATFWQMKLRKRGTIHFTALTENDVEDVFVLVEYII